MACWLPLTSLGVRYKIAGTLIMFGLAVSSLGIVTFAQKTLS